MTHAESYLNEIVIVIVYIVIAYGNAHVMQSDKS